MIDLVDNSVDINDLIDENFCPSERLAHGSRLDLSSAIKANRNACYALAEGDLSKALEESVEAIRFHSNWPAALQTYAMTQFHVGNFNNARRALERAIVIDPTYDPSYSALFTLLVELGNKDDALTVLDELDDQVPGLAETDFLRSTLLLSEGEYAGAAKHLDRGVRSLSLTPNSRMLPYGVVSKPRLLQDKDQLHRLMVLGKLPKIKFEAVLDGYELALNAFPKSEETDWKEAPVVKLDPELLSLIRPFYRRVVNLETANRTSYPAISEKICSEKVENEYLTNSDFPVAIIDNFLDDRVLNTLLNYLYDSTIWHNDAQLGRNYIGAYRQNGLSCPLVLQIAEELQSRFDKILGQHELLEFWAYRMVTGETGVGAHADSTAVNVNIWLTPSPESISSAGLKMFKSCAPNEWEYADYNANPELIDNLLEGVESNLIPYKQNRAVIFNSRIFHETGPLPKINRYEDGRINLTFLFGCELK